MYLLLFIINITVLLTLAVAPALMSGLWGEVITEAKTAAISVHVNFVN